MPDEGEEKTLPATPKRRQEARKQGQVARSPELGAALSLLALTCVLHAALPGAGGASLLGNVQQAFRFNPHQTAFTFNDVARWQTWAFMAAGRVILPLLGVALAVGLAANVAQVGLQITPEALAPKWERVDPIAGFKRLWSPKGAVELLKGILKMGIVGGVCYSAVRSELDNGDLLRTAHMALPEILATVGHLLWTLGLRVSVTLLLLAVADFAYQKYAFEKSIKMSLTEVKQENKNSEGSPEVKGRIRRLQREMAKRRMMADVPKADVVITNPTHFAVALMYEPGSPAPKVVAKGVDETAARIREIARENRVPLVENRPLARALHANVEIGDFIPGDMYEAVAQVLAFVFRTYGRRKRPGNAPLHR